MSSDATDSKSKLSAKGLIGAIVDSGTNILGTKKPKSFSCDHYSRKCEFFAPCCDKLYRCRFCHDAEENHKLDRDSVSHIVCSNCDMKQPIQSNYCQRCKICFGKYHCLECKLFDDDDERSQFHCEGCGICRVGGRNKYFHCEVCNMCLPIKLKGNHKCIENVSRTNCPVCFDDIHTSREPSQIPSCLHLIHRGCFIQLINNGHYVCPICYKSIVDQSELWKYYDSQIANTTMPPEYKGVYASALCRDCSKSQVVKYHFFALKCRHCKSYNTVRDKGPLFKIKGDTMVEFDATTAISNESPETVQAMGEQLQEDLLWTDSEDDGDGEDENNNDPQHVVQPPTREASWDDLGQEDVQEELINANNDNADSS